MTAPLKTVESTNDLAVLMQELGQRAVDLVRMGQVGRVRATLDSHQAGATGQGGAQQLALLHLDRLVGRAVEHDRGTGDLYIADVGQRLYEEVDVSSASIGGRGLNFGWNVMEGRHCYEATTCDQAGKTMPAIEYGHTGGACSITGGYVYRGTKIPALLGQYLYSDYCASFVKSFQFSGGAATNARDWPTLKPQGSVSSFGQDAKGELYILTLEGGVYRIVPSP